MEKEQINSKQGILLIALFVIGSSTVVGGVNEAKRDSWLAIILGALAALPFVLIYARLHKLRPTQNVFEMAQWVFGNVFGKIIVGLFAWYALHLSALITRNFAEFFIAISMPEAPPYFIALFLVVFRIAAIKSGIEVMGRLALFFAPIIFFILVFTVIIGASYFDLNNILPILDHGAKPLLEGTLSMFAFPFAETVIFLMAFGAFREGSKPGSIYTYGLALGCAFLLIVSLRNIFILGATVMTKEYYPSYTAVQIISLGNFFQRFEVIVAVVYLVCGFTKATLCAMAATKGVAVLFNVADYRKLVSPVSLMAALLSMILYKSSMQMFEWLVIYKHYALLFQVVLPVMLWVGVEMKCKLEQFKSRVRCRQTGQG